MIMKKISIFFGLVSIFLIVFGIVFPKNLGTYTPIWKLKERCLGDEYGELRSQYFITLSNKKLWQETDSIFKIWNDHDSFTITEVYLQVSEDVAENCRITQDGMIRWQKQSSVRIDADALTVDGLSVTVGMREYFLEETEQSIIDFEAKAGIEADELLKTISEIRSEYTSALQKLSEAEYREVCRKRNKAVVNLVVIWGVYMTCYIYVRIRRKRNHLQV